MTKNNEQLTFADFFAGIGGFHLAFKNIGAECVLACEKDNLARLTYQANFKISENKFPEDIRNLNLETIPSFDILCAGFPCQSFSIAGRKQGLNDTTEDEKGQMFFYLLDIIKAKKPKAFFFENVKNLLSIDNGQTFKFMEDLLRKEGYSFYYKIMKACDYGVPQLRPRVFMVGFKNDSKNDFEFPEPIPLKMTMSDVWGGKCHRDIGLTICVSYRNQALRPGKHPWDLYYIDGKERRLGKDQARQMQGFPKDFKFAGNYNDTWSRIGNAVMPKQMEAIAKHIKEIV